VNYLSGYRVDLDRIGKLCRENGCFFFVDAIQGMGALPLDVEASYIDALAADGHKWMLGPEGNGVLYIRRKWLDSIEPVEFGWTNPAGYADYSSRDMALRPDAGRYECGTLNTVGCFGLRAAIDFLLDVGIEDVAANVLSLADQLESGARAKGYEVIVPRAENACSGIVAVRHPELDARMVVSELKQKRILAAPRQGWVRMSPHFYLTSEDIQQVLDALPGV
jgi:selenocysteine lyase/cysteine desulfurase